MKNFRKFASVLLVVVMALALGATAFAAQEGTLTGGSITIDNAVVDQKYNIYQILYIESYDADSGAYSYKANSAWKTFVESTGIKDVYLKTDGQGYVTWVKNLTCTDEAHTHTDACYTAADAAAFAKLAQAYAKTNSTTITADGTATATTTTVSFTDLKLGYYLVDSTLGTLCSLDTTNPSVTIKEKNAVPTNEKKVQEDSKVNETDKGWGPTNDADIGQTVSFKSTITLPVGSENVEFYDNMGNGLTLIASSIKVYTDADMTTELASANYTLDTNPPTGGVSAYTFKIAFKQTYLDALTADTTLYVGYTATLNKDAVVGLPGNMNESFLKYGDSTNSKNTPASQTTTYTWDVDVLKYANGDESKVLSGAQFVLLKKVDNVEYFAVVADGKITGWTTEGVAPEEPDESKTYATVLTTGTDGKIAIDGLDADTYYLREVKAPAGYNILAEDKSFVIKGAETEDGKLTYETLVVKVENQSGTLLPSTGGMGTKVLYAIGALLVIGAGVLLVTKKRMSRSENG